MRVNGQIASGLTFGAPTKVGGTTYRYAFTGSFTQNGDVALEFLPSTWSDSGGTNNLGSVQTFFATTTNLEGVLPKPGPTAQLRNPQSGAAVSAGTLNAGRYLDVTFLTQNGSPIEAATITGDEFTLTGAGLGDVDLFADGRPVLIGAPTLLSGTTYRYYLKDKNTANSVELFIAGEVQVNIRANSFRTQDQTGNTARVEKFTITADAAGSATATNALSLGPLTLQGPTISIADFAFKNGLLYLTIAVGLNRASLAFGGSGSAAAGASQQQQQSGVTADLTGILGTFDIGVDVFGLLSGNVRVDVPGKFSLRVAGLSVVVPGVVTVEAAGIVINYDPAGNRTQEMVRIDSASITFPAINIRGSISPFDLEPNNPSNALLPGLIVRRNGFTLGQAELQYGGIPGRRRPANRHRAWRNPRSRVVTVRFASGAFWSLMTSGWA